MTSLPVASPASTLTRSEAAYAHLASFRRGDVVDVSGRGFYQPGTVTIAQRDEGTDIRRAFLVVEGCGTETAVSVASLLSGRFTITSRADSELGRTRYFDEAGYAAQAEALGPEQRDDETDDEFSSRVEEWMFGPQDADLDAEPEGGGESTGKLATLRADLRAAGWSAEVVRLSDEDRAEMVRDYGIEGA